MKRKFKIFPLVKSLTDSETRQIRKMLRSPFFINRIHIKDLFDVLVRLIQKKEVWPNPEQIYHAVYLEEVYNYARLRGAMSDLVEIIEECLLINARRADGIKTKLNLLEIYRNRNLEKSYKAVVNKTKDEISSQTKRNPAYYQNLLSFQIEKSKQFEGSKRADNLFLQDISDLEDVFFLAKKLRTACAQLSHQSVQKTTYDFGLLNLIVSDLESSKYLSYPTVAIYFYCYKFLSEPDRPEYFLKFKKTLNEYKSLFNAEDLSDSYRLAINYCIRKNNEGDHSFMRELWELYKNGLQQEILLIKNRIPRFTFDNAITAGLRLKEFKWVENFIRNESEKLNPVYREQSALFNLAKLAFEQQDYNKALIHIQNSDFTEERINIVGKIMLIKIYFELSRLESLDTHLENFGKYIRRKKVSENHRKLVLNTIRYVKRILSIATYATLDKQKLRTQIETEEILSEREWLLSKI